MGYIAKRGTRAAPRYYLQFKEAGKYRMIAAKGCRTLEEAKERLAKVEARIADGLPAMPEERAPATAMGPALEEWRKGLSNRNAAVDHARVSKRIEPTFAKLAIADVTLPVVMRWLDELASPRVGMSGEGRRQALNLLSRFFSWAIERGLATVNPVKMIPTGKRPTPARKVDGPWLEDDSKIPKLMRTLGPQLGEMFYLGNRSGLRTGELCGLRVGDLDYLAEGVIRVRFSYDGPLKEDSGGPAGKVKWAPAPEDIGALPYLTRRRAEASGDDLVFPFEPEKPQNRRRSSPWKGFRREHVLKSWNEAAKAAGVLPLTWYQATRHSFVSRNLKAGASLDEVSAAVGHSTPEVTKRFYDHFIRRSFSSTLRAGITRPARKRGTAAGARRGRKESSPEKQPSEARKG